MRSQGAGVFLIPVICLGCGAPRRPVHEIVDCDRSDSSHCTEARVRAAADRFVASNPPLTSKFTVVATGCDLSDAGVVFEVAVPRRWPGGVAKRKREWRERESERIGQLALPPLVPCSGIVASLWKSTRVFESDEQYLRKLTLVSDLREVSDLGNFEQSIPEPSVFVRQVKEKHLLPDLSKVAVLEICAVHTGKNPDGSPWSAERDSRLKVAWEALFREMGMKAVTFCESCSFDPPEDTAVVAPQMLRLNAPKKLYKLKKK